MSTKLQNQYQTVQVRISRDWHKQLKVSAALRGITMSKLFDKILSTYYPKNEDDLHKLEQGL